MDNQAPVGSAGHVHDLLSEYLNDSLADADRRAVEVHLRECVECRGDLTSLRFTVHAVRQLPMRPVPRNFAITAPTPLRTHRLTLWLRSSAAALAALFIMMLAGRLVLPSATHMTSTIQPTSVTSAPAAAQSAPAAAPRAFSAVRQTSTPSHAEARIQSQATGGTVHPNEAARPAVAAAPTEAPAAAPRPTSATAQPSTALQPRAAAPAAPGASSSGGSLSTAAAPAVTSVTTPAKEATGASRFVLPEWYTSLLVGVGGLAIVTFLASVWFTRRP